MPRPARPHWQLESSHGGTFTPHTNRQMLQIRESFLESWSFNIYQHTSPSFLPPCPNYLLDRRLEEAGEAEGGEGEEEEKENILTPPSKPVEHGSGLTWLRRKAQNLR